MNTLPDDVRSKLKQCRIRSVADFVSCAPGRIASMSGLPYKEVIEIRRNLLHEFGSCPVAASNLWEEAKSSSALLPTGCKNLDELLDGGLLTGELTEVCGPPGAGKTQVCLTLACHIAMVTSSTVVYIDTGGTFNPELVRHILTSRGGEDVEVLMKKIRVFQLFSLFDVLSALATLQENVKKQVDSYHSNLHLVIIDPLTSLISPLLGGQQTQGHSLMCQLAMSLRVLAMEQAIAVMYTNNMVTDFNQGGGLKPALGLTWSHTPSTRVTLSTRNTAILEGSPYDEGRVATITKSSKQAVGVSTTFIITKNGVQSGL